LTASWSTGSGVIPTPHNKKEKNMVRKDHPLFEMMTHIITKCHHSVKYRKNFTKGIAFKTALQAYKQHMKEHGHKMNMDEAREGVINLIHHAYEGHYKREWRE
jgi:hypothetical protein